MRSGATWSEQQKLTPSDGVAGDWFGRSVTVSGDTAIIGAPYNDGDGDGTSEGSAYVFVRSGATWSEQQKLLASDGVANDQFGTSVVISSDTAIIGAPNDVPTGSAYVYESPPVPDIKANGLDGPVTINQGDNLNVTIALDPGSYSGENADWWILIFYYDQGTGSLIPIVVTNFLQAPLFDLPPLTILNTTGLPAGVFIFFFGVDMDANGTFDPDQLYSDLVAVIIQ